MKRAPALLVLLAGLAVAAPAAPAPASTIVYSCGANICSIKPDGTKKRKLTKHGSFGLNYYERPQLTANGKQMVFGYGKRVWVANARARKKRAVPNMLHSLYVGLRPGRRQAFFLSVVPTGSSSNIVDALCRFSLKRPRTPTCSKIPNGYLLGFDYLGWGPGNTITGVDDFRHRLCVIGSDFTCARTLALAYPPKTFFMQTTVSPNGKYIVASLDMGPVNEDTRVSIFSAATGKLLRYVTRGHSDYPAAWSPDSKRLVFVRDATTSIIRTKICTVRKSGGKVRCIVKPGKNLDPSWGG